MFVVLMQRCLFFPEQPPSRKYPFRIQKGGYWAKHPISQCFKTHCLSLQPNPYPRSPLFPPPYPVDVPKRRDPLPPSPCLPPRAAMGCFSSGMLLSVLVILLLSMLYEAIKMGKAVLLRRALLALPRSLSRESLVESEEGNTHPTQSRYLRDPVGTSQGCVSAPWARAEGEKGCGRQL